MNTAIQIRTKGSRFKIPQRSTKSAFDKNLNANASSINPKMTLTTSNQDPDLGRFFSSFGNNAKIANGTPNPIPNPENAGVMNAEFLALASTNPRIGPVQEKETMAKVNAIKKIPINVPVPDLLSSLLPRLAGNDIS